jgi:hypothetical protein
MNTGALQSTGGAVDNRVRAGTIVTGTLGVVLVVPFMTLGCFITWRSDRVLGLYQQTGWEYSNLVQGDGKIALALAVTCFICLVLGACLAKKSLFLVVLGCSVAAIALATYEIIFISTRPGITGPGTGLYTVLGAGVMGVLIGLCGYSILTGKSGIPDISGQERDDE